jgi:hypothetical protein
MTKSPHASKGLRGLAYPGHAGLYWSKPEKSTTGVLTGCSGFSSQVPVLSGVLAHSPGGEYFPRASQQGAHQGQHTGHVGVRRVGGHGLIIGPAS